MALDVWMLPLGKGIFSYDLDQPLLFVNSQQFHRWDQNVDPLKKFISNKPGLLSYHCLFFPLLRTNFSISWLESKVLPIRAHLHCV